MNKRIIVGYDGSPASHAAMTWALDEAARIEAPVELVYVDEYPFWQPAASMVPSSGGRPQSYTGEVIEPMLDRAATAARQRHPLVTVTTAIVRAHPAAALVARSARAALMVLGGHGAGAVAGLLGSVGTAVSGHARCPVVVVRGTTAPVGPVVAGIDDSAVAAEVLSFAASHAAAHKVPLHIIRAWKPVTGMWERTPMDTHAVTAAERRPFDALVTLINDTYPALEITADAVVGHPAEVLVRASAGAQTMIVGTRGRGPLKGLLMGSVSQHLLRHAACPVAVVPDAISQI